HGGPAGSAAGPPEPLAGSFQVRPQFDLRFLPALLNSFSFLPDAFACQSGFAYVNGQALTGTNRLRPGGTATKAILDRMCVPDHAHCPAPSPPPTDPRPRESPVSPGSGVSTAGWSDDE